VEEEEVK
jgi:hypothetical protein